MRVFLFVTWCFLLILIQNSITAQKSHTVFFQEQFNKHKNEFNALSVSVTNAANILFSSCYGIKNKATPCQPENIFPIASVTKMFTTTAAMSTTLRENLDTPVRDIIEGTGSKCYVPGSTIIGNYNSWVGRPSFTSKNNEPFEDVKVRDLMQHTSGFDERQLGLSAKDEKSIQTDYSKYFEKQTRRLIRIRPREEIISYSNIGMTLLGHLVELKNEKKFSIYLQDEIFDPLSLHNTSYGYNESVFQSDNFARPLFRSGKTVINMENFGQYINMAPSGAIYSNVIDLSQFLRMHLNDGVIDGNRILLPDDAKDMRDIQFSHQDNVPGIGLGWFQGIYNDVDYSYHNGDLRPYHSTVAIFKDKGFGVAMLSTGSDKAPTALQDIMAAFIDEYIKPFNCSAQDGPNIRRDPKTGTCYKAKLVKDLQNINDASRLRGCYVSSRYEHTTWYKIGIISQPYFCVMPRKNYIAVSGKPSFYLALDDDGIFRPGSVVGSEFRFSYPYSKGFGFLKSDSNVYRYMFLNQIPFEYQYPIPAFEVVILSFFLLQVPLNICILLACNACLCCECFRNMYKSRDVHVYQPLPSGPEEAEEQQLNYSSAEELSRYKGLNSYAIQDIDAAVVGMGMTTKKKMPRKKLGNRQRTCIASAVDCGSICISSLMGILLMTHIVGMIVHATLINPLKFYPQRGVMGLEFFLTIPIVTTVVNVLTLIVWVINTCSHIFIKRSCFGACWITFFGFTILIQILYVPFAMSFNWYGPTYAN